MRIAYLDCNAGISGNMFLGALIDLGLPVDFLTNELRKLPLTIPDFKLHKVSKKGIAATWFDTIPAHEHEHRHLTEILTIIDKAGYSKSITGNASDCFRFLAEAEAKTHGVSVEEIHFHEVGAVDAIIDVVSACIGIEFFKIDQIIASPVRVGFGMIRCSHGEIPLPAPAALELLTKFNIFGGEYEGEWTTPTGATILKTFAATSNSIPLINIDQIGYGAGTAERPIPNVLRLVLGNFCPTEEKDYQVILETNIDDLNPEVYGFLGETLLKNGARDYYLTSIYMKKGRPGILVTVIAPPENVPQIEDLLFRQTSTLGIRKYLVERHCLNRDYQTVDLGGIKIRIKTAWQNGKLIKFAPEYNDCLLAAEALNKPLKDIYDEANFQFRIMFNHEGSC